MKKRTVAAGMLDRRCALAGVGALLAGQLGDAAAQQGSVVAWPPLTLLDGTRLGSDAWVDTAAVVVFWTTWCPFCRRHNARIEQLHRSAQGPHLRVLGVALDGDAAALRRYMVDNGYHFPVVVGEPGLRARFTARRVIPMTCLVDRRGRFLQAIPGEMADADVLALAGLAGPVGS